MRWVIWPRNVTLFKHMSEGWHVLAPELEKQREVVYGKGGRKQTGRGEVGMCRQRRRLSHTCPCATGDTPPLTISSSLFLCHVVGSIPVNHVRLPVQKEISSTSWHCAVSIMATGSPTGRNSAFISCIALPRELRSMMLKQMQQEEFTESHSIAASLEASSLRKRKGPCNSHYIE